MLVRSTVPIVITDSSAYIVCIAISISAHLKTAITAAATFDRLFNGLTALSNVTVSDPLISELKREARMSTFTKLACFSSPANKREFEYKADGGCKQKLGCQHEYSIITRHATYLHIYLYGGNYMYLLIIVASSSSSPRQHAQPTSEPNCSCLLSLTSHRASMRHAVRTLELPLYITLYHHLTNKHVSHCPLLN
jgi:hypothetical protein